MGKRGKGFDASAAKSRISEVNSKIENAEAQAEQLESDKMQALEKRTQLEGDSEASERIQEKVSQEYATAIEQIQSKGQEVSSELNEGNAELEEVKQEAGDAKSANERQRNNVEGMKKMLDAIGIHAMDGAISELDSDMAEIDGVLEEATEAMHHLQQVSSKLGGL